MALGFVPSLTAHSGRSSRYICAVCWQRNFSASSGLAKKVPSLTIKAPSTMREAERKAASRVIDLKQGPWNEALRKTNFRMAASFKFLKCDLDTAEKIFAELQRRKRVDAQGVLSLAKEHKVELVAITAIARLLLRQMHSRDLRQMGSSLLASCADAGERFAIVGMTRIGLMRGEINRPYFQKYMPKLAQLAKRKNDPKALIAYAAALEKRGQIQEAVNSLEKALDSGDADDTIDEDALDKVMRNSDDSSIALNDAYAELGRLYFEHIGDEEKAKRAYQKGAFLADDPQAYHGLAQFEIDISGGPDEKVYSEQWVEFETKAAASGHPDAQLELANFYVMTEGQAVDHTTSSAFKLLQKAQNHTLSPVVGLLYMFDWWIKSMERIRRLDFETSPPAFPRRLSFKTSWALEWYTLCSMAPPPRVKPFLGMLRCLHHADMVDSAIENTRMMLEDEDYKPTKQRFSPEDLASLQRYLETEDIRWLDGMSAEAEEASARVSNTEAQR